MSEFLIVSSTFAREPLLAVILVFGLLVGFGALFHWLDARLWGAARIQRQVKASYVPMFAHLALVFAAGSICRRTWSHGFRMWQSF